jgi:hypothetical protein
MPTFRVVAKYQPKVGHELFGRFRDLVIGYRVKWTHDCNPNGTGNVYEIIVHEYGRALHISDELIKLGMDVEVAQVVP